MLGRLRTRLHSQILPAHPSPSLQSQRFQSASHSPQVFAGLASGAIAVFDLRMPAAGPLATLAPPSPAPGACTAILAPPDGGLLAAFAASPQLACFLPGRPSGQPPLARPLTFGEDLVLALAWDGGAGAAVASTAAARHTVLHPSAVSESATGGRDRAWRPGAVFSSPAADCAAPIAAHAARCRPAVTGEGRGSLFACAANGSSAVLELWQMGEAPALRQRLPQHPGLLLEAAPCGAGALATLCGGELRIHAQRA